MEPAFIREKYSYATLTITVEYFFVSFYVFDSTNDEHAIMKTKNTSTESLPKVKLAHV